MAKQDSVFPRHCFFRHGHHFSAIPNIKNIIMLWWWWCRSRCFLLSRTILTLAKLISRSLLRKVKVIHMFPVRLQFHLFRDASYDYDTAFQYVPFKAITFGWLWVVMLADQWLVCTVSSWHGILVGHMCGVRGPQILTSWRRRWRHLLQSCRIRLWLNFSRRLSCYS